MEQESSKDGRVTLTEMLKALDKTTASGLERRLKKLSKKKSIEKPLDKNKADTIVRKTNYSQTSREISKWEPVIERQKKAKQIVFPLDQEPDVLPSTNEALNVLKPSNDLEKDVMNLVNSSQTVIHDNRELSRAEEKYLKAISLEEAKARHMELQRMRVLLSSYAAKMRRQKAIKSKSYRKLLKQERVRKHVKKVESNKDLLMDEIEKLHRLRAQERASLKHKNTGKWAKHAKFRAKYDENARMAMLEQIGIASKLLEKPADDDDDEDDSETDESHDEDEVSVSSEDEDLADTKTSPEEDTRSRSTTLAEILGNVNTSHIKTAEASDEEDDSEADNEDDSDDEQRKLMAEAFESDDVVAEFQKAKSRMADEEQPKDVDLFLPGWNDWAGPGIKVNKRKRNKYRIKAKKLPRRDDKLGNVIISENADDKIKELQVKKVPRGLRDEKHLTKTLCEPTVSTFVKQSVYRNKVRPKIVSKMGTRIEPMSKKLLHGGNKAKWLE